MMFLQCHQCPQVTPMKEHSIESIDLTLEVHSTRAFLPINYNINTTEKDIYQYRNRVLQIIHKVIAIVMAVKHHGRRDV